MLNIPSHVKTVSVIICDCNLFKGVSMYEVIVHRDRELCRSNADTGTGDGGTQQKKKEDNEEDDRVFHGPHLSVNDILFFSLYLFLTWLRSHQPVTLHPQIQKC